MNFVLKQKFGGKIKKMETIILKNNEYVPDDFTGIVLFNGIRSQWKNGKKHCIGAPAVEHPDGSYEWWQNGKWHREDGPALEQANGDKYWFQNDKLHRIGGPAVKEKQEMKWYQNGKLHHLEGPALKRTNGEKYWYILDQELTEQEFGIFQYMWRSTSKKKTKKLMKIFVKLARVK